MRRFLVIASAAAVLIATGFVHGVWTDRWAEPADLAEAAQRLHLLPTTVGAWQGSDVAMDDDPNSALAGMIARRYFHSPSGKSVTILLACGRPGAVCTHTPEVCYAGSGFEVEKPKRFQLASAGAAAPPEFWTARFVRERAGGRTHLRLFWSWHGADGWRVADNPRLSFAGEKILYKLYLIREMIQPDEPIEHDPCLEFMRDLLPAIARTAFMKATP